MTDSAMRQGPASGLPTSPSSVTTNPEDSSDEEDNNDDNTSNHDRPSIEYADAPDLSQQEAKEFPHINAPTDPNFKPDKIAGAFLSRVPLLHTLTEEECAILGGNMVSNTYKKGDVIIKQGDLGEGFYIMQKGQAQVTRKDPSTKEEKVLDLISETDYFGEAALLNNCARGASVIANTDCVALFLHRDKFHALFNMGDGTTAIAFAKRSVISSVKKVTENTTMEIKPPIDPYREKDDKTHQMLVNALKDQVLFAGMEEAHKLKIISKMWRIKIAKGTTVIRQGDPGDNLYVLEKGKMDVLIRTADGKGTKKVDTMKTAGKCFGELALLYDTPRNATVVAAAKSTLWVLDRITFRLILRNVTEQRLKQYEEFLAGVELLAPLSAQERSKIAEALDTVWYKDGDTIVTQGERGDAMYFICSGTVQVTRKHDDQQFVVNRLTRGDFFGELCLLGGDNEVRTATVTCIGGRVEVAKLDRYAFQLLLGPVNSILQGRAEAYRRTDTLVAKHRRSVTFDADGESKDGGTLIPAVSSNSKRILPEENKNYHLEDLEVIGFLGKGGYGYVELVRHKQTQETFALKTLYRSHIIKTKSTHNVVNEKKMLIRMDSPQIIRLHATFKDQTRLYFLLEPALGGELFTLLRLRSVFNDKTAKFYAASVILGLEEIHSRDVVYRDLKPENLLLDSQGYIKIADFGLSKHIPEGRTFTVCGTPHYLAPEIIAGVGHGKAVDFWCLGVLIYEMLAGRPPFYRQGEKADHMKLYRRITSGDYLHHALFTDEAWNLIRALLQIKPSSRLGVGVDGYTRLKKHPWFVGIDWHAIQERTARAPIIPFIRTNADLHNFRKPNPNYKRPNEPPPEGDQSWDAEF